jgi:membrane associated rhomboid family serine protease
MLDAEAELPVESKDEIHVERMAALKFLNNLERKMIRFRIPPFYQYLVFAMAGIYLLDLFFPSFLLIFKLSLVSSLIFKGEVWRLLTFLIIPPGGSILQTALTLYFFYFIGSALENRWGARRFLVYYAVGALAAILAGLLTGFGTNQFLNLSLFFAFAITYPDFQILLFFVLPIKVKWLALLNAFYYLYAFVQGGLAIRISIVFSLLNILLFFGGDLLNITRNEIRQWRRRQQFKRNTR